MLQVLWITCLYALQPKQHSREMSACESQSFLSSRHYHTVYLCSKMFSWSSRFNRSLCSSCNKVALEAMWKSTNHVLIWFCGWDKDISSPSWFLQYCSELATIFIWTQNEYDWCCIFSFFSSLKCKWYLMGILILICYICLFMISEVWYLADFFFFFFHLGTGTWAFISDLPEHSTNLFVGDERWIHISILERKGGGGERRER